MSRTQLCLTPVLLALVPLASAADLKDPQEVLRRAADALSNTHTVSYSATFTGTNWVKELVPHVTGKVVIGPTAEYDVPRFFTEAQVTDSESETAAVYTAGCNGNEYFIVDPKTKMGYMDMDPAVMGSNARTVQRLVIDAFSSTEPLKTTRAAATTTLKDETTIDGVACYVVQADTSRREKAMVWAIAKSDFLPRRLTRIYAGRNEGEPDGTTEITLTTVVANPKLKKDQFEMVLPEGFKKSDDFAP